MEENGEGATNMRQDEQKAELIAKIREKLKTMSDQDVLRVIAAYEASEKREKQHDISG